MIALDPYRGGAPLSERAVFKLSRDYEAYLTGKDDNFADSSCGLILQELTHDEAACRAGADNGKVLVARHEVCDGMRGGPRPLRYIYTIVRLRAFVLDHIVFRKGGADVTR
jgi:hypothetical protein